MSSLILPRSVDPASLRPIPRHRPMFDPSPARNRGMPGIANHCSNREWDNKLIATAVELGCPRQIAEECRTSPPARWALLTLWCAVQDAAGGDAAAKRVVDRCRHAFEHQASVSEILSAREQPANSAEIQGLLGLN